MINHERQWVAAWLCERYGCSDASDRSSAIAERIANARGIAWRTTLMKRLGRLVVDAVMEADRYGRDRHVAARRLVADLPPDEVKVIAQTHAPTDGDTDPLRYAQAAATTFADPLIDELDAVRASLRSRLEGRWLASWMDGQWLAELQRRRLWTQPVCAPKSLPTVQDLAVLFAVMVHRHTGSDPQDLTPDDAVTHAWVWADGRDTLRLLQLPLDKIAAGTLEQIDPGWSRRFAASVHDSAAPRADAERLELLVDMVRTLRIEPEGRPLSDVEIPTATFDQLIDPTRRPWRWPDPTSLQARPNPFRN